MGAIVAEELKKSDKMAGREEKILVLVRLRPLNEKEISKNEVADWECINESTILYRNSLQERSGLPTAYSFDRVFSGDCPSKQVYEEGTKEIALSVVSGINSSIFAYGQTSSGKTYTMNAITEFTVADIYDYIQRHDERAFALKFSAMEIYNENVRDLLSSDSTPLRLMDDPEKGTIVENLTEEKLKDWNHLRKLLSVCEAQRKIGETSLNEQSSRSHQILKLTIESSAREFLGNGNSSTLSASVFLIDLAGSERASQAMSAGTRLKEGCHINRSLLTLGNVIRKLSEGRQGHINYRDSKLTRILQPCLGGNARTTIICTLSPARSHVEQSRNTLLFASCAKQVTTNAQVNVVMSDKALVKHLQKELARLESELRSPAPTSSSCNCSVTIRKKDIQLEKMDKEIRDLTKQRDLAQSRVEDLLQIIRNDQSPNKQERPKNPTKRKMSIKLEDEDSMSDSTVNGHHYPNDIQDEDGESCIDDPSPWALENGEECKSEMGVSDDQCRDVRCIEMEESETSSTTFGNGHAASNGNISNQNGFLYGSLEQMIQEVQKSIDSLVSPQPENPSVRDNAPDTMRTRNLDSNRSQSKDFPSERFTNTVTLPSSKEDDYTERTPPREVESDFAGGPGELRKFAVLENGVNSGQLSRNGSQSSFGTEGVDEVGSQTGKIVADEEITSVQTFVAELKDAKLQYEKQFGESEAPSESRKTSRDVGLDPMIAVEDNTTDWCVQFGKLQKEIIELWQTCNISLVRRTYFFLLFKGDPSDSIYLEVELRRLTFLKVTLTNGGQFQNLVSSEKELRKERETLSRLINKRFSSNERKILYSKWGIKLDSKRRRHQLLSQLWTDTKDLDHVEKSATIIAKLVKFAEQGRVLKGMFGLSFSPPSIKRRPFGWSNSRALFV